MGYTYTCFLCKCKASKNDNISLHSFPKNPMLRQQWKQICGLTEADDVSRVYICSTHFAADSLQKGDSLLKSKTRLKIGAVPSISVPVKITTPPITFETMNIIDHCMETKNSSVEMYSTQSSSTNCGFCLTERAVNNDENTSYPASNEYFTPQKRRFAEPRYISEISTSDFSTPKRARRVLRLVKETDEKKSKMIKSLQNQVKRLRDRIVSLRDMIQHLTDKGFMTEDAGDNLMVTYT